MGKNKGAIAQRRQTQKGRKEIERKRLRAQIRLEHERQSIAERRARSLALEQMQQAIDTTDTSNIDSAQQAPLDTSDLAVSNHRRGIALTLEQAQRIASGDLDLSTLIKGQV